VKRERQPASAKLFAQLVQPLREGVLDCNRQVRHPRIQELVVIEFCPVRAKGKTPHPQGS
jgi:hypothetical protein